MGVALLFGMNTPSDRCAIVVSDPERCGYRRINIGSYVYVWYPGLPAGYWECYRRQAGLEIYEGKLDHNAEW